MNSPITFVVTLTNGHYEDKYIVVYYAGPDYQKAIDAMLLVEKNTVDDGRWIEIDAWIHGNVVATNYMENGRLVK